MKEGSKEYKTIIKLFKHQYRCTGKINVIDERYTPFNVIWDDYSLYLSHKSGISDDEFLLCLIYDYVNNGGGLYKIFEELSYCFKYSQYSEVVLKSDKYSQEIKNILLNSSYEKVYNLILSEETSENFVRTNEINQILENFEIKESNKLNLFVEEINKTFETMAIEHYLEKYRYQGLPNNFEKLFFSKDKRKRIYIKKKENKNYYVVTKDMFKFEDELVLVQSKTNELYSPGYWISEKSYGIYSDTNTAINDLQNELVNYFMDNLDN